MGFQFFQCSGAYFLIGDSGLYLQAESHPCVYQQVACCCVAGAGCVCLNHALCRYVAVMDNARLFLTDAEANELIEVPYIHMCVYINICLCIYIYIYIDLAFWQYII